MQRKHLVSSGFGVACLGFTALLVATGSASGQLKAHNAAKATIVNVTIGKPSELAFTLSKFSDLPAGTITFKVKNAGLGTHNFKICTTPTANDAKNACVGKATKLLTSGQSATLTVILKKSGKYEYLCAVPGHAAAGMKSLLGVGVKVTPPAIKKTTTTTSTTTTATTTTATTTTTAATTTTATPSECPPGETIKANGTGDGDLDDAGAASDGDGCL